MKRLPTINMVGEYCILIQELHETVSTLVADPTKADAFFFAQDHGLNVYRMTSADPETEAIWSSPTSTALCCLRAALPVHETLNGSLPKLIGSST